MKNALVQALDFDSIFLNPAATHNDGTYSQTPDLTLCRTINGRNTALFMVENKQPLSICAGKPLDLTGGCTSSKATIFIVIPEELASLSLGAPTRMLAID